MNLKWIEVNLPWHEANIPEPDLTEDEIKEFGTSRADIMARFGTMIDEINYKLFELGDNEAAFEAWLAEDPKCQEAWEAGKLLNTIQEWVAEHPKLKAHAKACRRATFMGQGLNRPGTLIEMADGTRHLIGTINELGGVCDDCRSFDDSDIVRRYAVIMDWEEK